MILHLFQTHERDLWCLNFHISTYLKFCDRIVVAVDESPALTASLNRLDHRITAFDFTGPHDLPAERVNEHGMLYHEGAIRQASLDVAMTLEPTLLVFGDTDEVPTPDVVDWMQAIAARPQNAERWYVHWVTLFGDYNHAIGGDSNWSFQSARGNKKCLAMQPGGGMRYTGNQHSGMEPGRFGGGPAPTGAGRWLIDSPKLLHQKYGSQIYAERPESKLSRHAPDEMLKGGHVVDVPIEWLWEGMPA